MRKKSIVVSQTTSLKFGGPARNKGLQAYRSTTQNIKTSPNRLRSPKNQYSDKTFIKRKSSFNVAARHNHHRTGDASKVSTKRSEFDPSFKRSNTPHKLLAQFDPMPSKHV